MNTDPESGPVRESLDAAVRDLGALADALGGQLQPTARNIVTAVDSARSAGADVWRFVNILARRSEDRTPEPDSGAAHTHDAAAQAVTSVLSARAAGSRVWRGLERLAEQPPVATAVDPIRRAAAQGVRRESEDALRVGGTELITRSQRAGGEPDRRHPAFARILPELQPEEARILRFLAVAGPQPAIDIRTKTLFQIGSERLASRISMVAEMASCRWPERDQYYFANLERLGLVRFSTEPVDDFRRYALIEVQPRAAEATARAKKSISIYRSIDLSPFGEQFCDVCFDLTGYDAGGWGHDERGDKIIGRGVPQ